MVEAARTILEEATYRSSSGTISSVLIVPNNYGIISLTTTITAVSIQLRMSALVGPNASNSESEPLVLMIITMLRMKTRMV